MRGVLAGANCISSCTGHRSRLEENEGDGRYRESSHSTTQETPRTGCLAHGGLSITQQCNTKAQSETGSCEISMQAAPSHLTSLCLGTEARHLISSLCHLSEDRLCPCPCCLTRHYHCSSTEGHPANTPKGLTGHSRPLGWLLLLTKLGFKGTI